MNSRNVVVIVLLVLVLLLGGAAYAFRHQIRAIVNPVKQETLSKVADKVNEEQTETVKEAAGEKGQASMTQVEVDYTASGFTPASVTVKKGATVKFVNKSGNSMEVASNPHPTHTDYPGFDQWKSTSKGKDEYDFTFDKVGTWGFHNHLNPSDRGTVVVTE